MALPNTSFNLGQTETVTATPEDSGGNPGTLAAGNIPTWAASPSGIVSINPAANGLSAQLTGTGTGSTTVTVTGNNGAGTIFSQFTVTVQELPASQFGFTFGSPS